MIARYRLLAQVALLDDYYADGACPDFAFVPSSSTASLLAERRLLWKTVGNKLLVLVQVDSAGRPVTDLAPDLRLVFHLDLVGMAFLTVSNIDTAALRSRRFHFTNLAANAAGAPAVLNLSRPVPPFDNAKGYIPGDFSRVGSAVFECIKAGAGQPPNAPNSAFWINKGPVHYASKPDMLPLRTMVAGFSLLIPARAFRIRVFALNPGPNDFTLLVRDTVAHAGALEATRDVQADLTGLPPGRYRLDINGETFEAWFDDEAVSRGAFGVVEIHNHLPAADAYSLVDAAGTVKETAYAIRFGNRRAFWKYATPLHKVADILVNGDHTQPSPFTPGSADPGNPAQKDFFLSKAPLALTEAPGDNLFDLIIGSETRPAPKPDPRLPGMLTQAFDGGLGAYTDHVATIRLNH